MMPKPTGQPDRELQELLSAIADGDLSETQAHRLAERLRTEPEARAAYIDATVFEAMLGAEFPCAAEFEPKNVIPSPVRWRWAGPLAVGAIAAVIALGIFIADRAQTGPTFQGKDTLQTFAPKAGAVPLAWVTAVRGARVKAGSFPVKVGKLLPSGTIDLESGVVELTFFSGARVIIEGNCRFELESEFRGFLHSGRLTAHVPPQAEGFVVDTPSSHIRDLGTAFALDVASSGSTELHVLEGLVEASPLNLRTPHRVHSNEAVRIDEQTVQEMPFVGRNWVTSLPATAEKLPRFVHWSFDSANNGTVADEKGRFPLKLKHRPATPSGLKIVPGVIGEALSFDADGGYATSDYPGIAASRARAVAFWVRLPRTPPPHANAMVSWGKPDANQWQVGWNANSKQGVLGAVRQEFGKGYVIGTTDLRDGRWHHVAVVFLWGEWGASASRVKIYVDGRLDGISARRQGRGLTSITAPGRSPVTLGRHLSLKRSTNRFRGVIDEAYIFEGPLTPRQVAQLAKAP